MLLDAGERPAILSRGYGRRDASGGVTVVSDADGLRCGVDRSGDEPQMLARALPGVPVLVGADRYLSGRFAEERLAATVHLLDDGFQHLGLDRDLDLLVTSEEDLSEKPLPAGRLREGLDAALSADAALVTTSTPEQAARVAAALGVARCFRVERRLGEPQTLSGESAPVAPGTRVLVVAGIARPERFFADVASVGWSVAGTVAFRDHHRFDARDLNRIADALRAAGAALVLTTEKDGVRLNGPLPAGLLVRAVPLTASIEPAESFRDWLIATIRSRRAP
jgi:tetraacyldisaccharide 4'-kinase